MYVAYSYAQVWSACMEVFAVKGRKLSWHVSDRNGACIKFDFVMRFRVVFVYSTSMQIYPHESFTVWTKNECGKFRKFSVTNFRKPRGVILFSGNNRKYRSICPFRKFRRKVSVLWNILRIVYRFNRNTTVQKKKKYLGLKWKIVNVCKLDRIPSWNLKKLTIIPWVRLIRDDRQPTRRIAPRWL